MAGIPLLLSLLLGQVITAPRTTHMDRSEEYEDLKIQNPMSTGPEQLRLLQGYLEHADPLEKNAFSLKRETVILHLILLHDYDKSGQLDGLELMHFLSRILSHATQRPPHPNSVVRLVDEILEKQDVNRDGLLDAPELMVPTVYGDDTVVEEENQTVPVVIPPPPAAQDGNKAESVDNLTNMEERSVEEVQVRAVESQDVIEESVHSSEEPMLGESDELTAPMTAEGVTEDELEAVVVGSDM